MTSRRIAIIQGHPDPRGRRFGHALAAAYADAAVAAGHAVEVIDVASLDFPLLTGQVDWEQEPPPPAIRGAQQVIGTAEHLVIFYPLWLGTMPALLKAFFEQLMRPGFAIDVSEGGRLWKKLLKGRSARIVVTMGMPAFVYRWYFRAHSLKSFERNILHFCGIGPVRETLIGLVGTGDGARHEKWLQKMRRLGAAAR